MPLAVIEFDFDPVLRLGAGIAVRWQTVALAGVIAVALVIAAVIGRRRGLRADDLLYIAIGIVPGAVVAGRLGYGLLHADVFAADPRALLDPSRGGLELALGVAGGALSGAYVAALLGAPVGRWAHAAAFPMLLGIAFGKLSMILGGSGQGLPTDASWATSFAGPGPWGSLAPTLPSHPAQAYEGLAVLGIVVVLAVIVAAGGFARQDGRLLLVGIAEWALARAAVSLAWSDPPIVGPMNAGGLIAAGVALVSVCVITVMTVRTRGSVNESTVPAAEPSWPDPAARPRF